MKLSVNQSLEFEQTEITINCRTVTPELKAIIEQIRLMDCSVSGEKDGEVFKIPLESVLYFDSADANSFAYSKNACYRVKATIAELEQKYADLSFVRISKNTIVSTRALKSAKAIEFSRMLITLVNGEQLIVSRHYLSNFKEAFGL